MQENFQHQPLIHPKLDLMREKEGLDFEKKRQKYNIFLKIFLGIFVFGAILATIFSYKAFSSTREVFQGEKKSSLFSQFKRLILSDDKKIDGEAEGRTNILLLGMGGEGHEGALLTDTIMVASIKYNGQEKPNVALISIPRDLSVKYENGDYKINSIYARAIQDQYLNQNGASNTTADVVSQTLGIPIHYYIRVDFEGFKKIVDSLDGIEVEIKNSFYDPQYPTDDFGYQVVTFEKGKQILNGEKALQYTRSRHGIVTDGEGDEASDFARTNRQQQILEAIKIKAFSIFTFVNPNKVNGILEAFGDHVRTNLEPSDILRFFDLARNINQGEIINKTIDDRESGLLYSTTSYSGEYILLPKNNDFSEIQKFAQNIFKNEDLRGPKIILLNGTEIPNLAKKYAGILKKDGFNIVLFSNAQIKDYEKTVIYNKVKHANPDVLKSLRDTLFANIGLAVPAQIKDDPQIANKEWDMIVVLGESVGEDTNQESKITNHE